MEELWCTEDLDNPLACAQPSRTKLLCCTTHYYIIKFISGVSRTMNTSEAAPPRRSARVAERNALHFRAERPPRGVVVLHDRVSVDADDAAELRLLVSGAAPIFNPDDLRTQTSLSDCKLLRRLRNALVDACVLAEGLRMNDAVVIHSSAGCAQQAWHTDFDPITMKNCVTNKPAGVILAIEEGTTFEEYPNTTHKLNVGDILVFDGDVVHAGSAYAKENVRVHAYIDACDVQRVHNTTYLLSATHSPTKN